MGKYDELMKRLRNVSIELGQVDHVSVLLLEAVDAIEHMQKTIVRLENELGIYDDLPMVDQSMVLSKKEKTTQWIPVTERLPENGVHVLLSCKCGSGAYVCDGFHTEKYSTPTQFYEDIDADYDEDTDEYYFPEGWWEVIKNWDDYSCVAIEDTVTHWIPLPEPPKEET